jgi:hypothetical protein
MCEASAAESGGKRPPGGHRNFDDFSKRCVGMDQASVAAYGQMTLTFANVEKRNVPGTKLVRVQGSEPPLHRDLDFAAAGPAQTIIAADQVLRNPENPQHDSDAVQPDGWIATLGPEVCSDEGSSPFHDLPMVKVVMRPDIA